MSLSAQKGDTDSILKPLQETSATIVSKFKCLLEGYPRIYTTKENEVWLGGYESKELLMVNLKDQVLRKRHIYNRPNALAVMDCGDVIISPHPDDSRSVSRIMSDGRVQHLFDASPVWCYGVSVTADQEILICTLDGRVVRTNGVGTNIEQIYKGFGDDSVIHAVEDADGNIYISDGTIPAVVMVSKDGKVLSKIRQTTEGQTIRRPAGLLMDKMGNILCADQDKHCIYIIDQNQQMRELVGRSYDIQYPRWLAGDGDNNLWIAQLNGTIQVVKYC